MQRPDHYDTSSSELLYSTQLHQHHTCAPTFNSRSPLAGQEALLHSSNCTTTHNCFHTMLHGHHQPHLCPSLLLQLPLKIEQEASITTAHFTITVSSWCQPHLRPDLELQLPLGGAGGRQHLGSAHVLGQEPDWGGGELPQLLAVDLVHILPATMHVPQASLSRHAKQCQAGGCGRGSLPSCCHRLTLPVP